MSDQAKIRRILKFINLLTSNRSYKISEIAYRLEVNERTAYRYVESFENAGFVFHKENSRYRLITDKGEGRKIDNLFHFTEEEVIVLQELLDQIEGEQAIKNRIIKKLHTLYDFNTITQLSITSTITHIRNLKKAIKQRQRVILKEYRSSHSQIIKDRIVEAFEFMPDYEGIWCYEIKSKSVKQFRLSRIKEVQIINEEWEFEEMHKTFFTDIFRISAEKPIDEIKISMRLKAYNLLIEEYPSAKNYIKQKGKQYILQIPIASYEGIARFLIGLPEDINIIESSGLKNFLIKKIKIWNNKND